jgi:CDP-glucose 4,6-dehydratase
MEAMGMNHSFWQGKKVFLTGNTGFKGSWLSLWLHYLGVEVAGYALKPPANHYLFYLCGLSGLIPTTFGDVADVVLLTKTMQTAQPEIVIHMAAQPLVREAYKQPILTYRTNVLGTAHLLEAVRNCSSVKAVINVTTDKCYKNREWVWGYRETDSLGGYDPYSSSKACSEIITDAYRDSFFAPTDYAKHGVAIATVRAGNVIGGGDWSEDRLLPDIMLALLTAKPVMIRYPESIRPWQHVLEPLSGYLTLAEKLYQEGPTYGESWNFGPDERDAKPVRWIAERVCRLWGAGAKVEVDTQTQPHEAHYLKLDCSKAHTRLDWWPRWDLETALKKTVAWFKTYCNNGDLQQVCLDQIQEYVKTSFF